MSLQNVQDEFLELMQSPHTSSNLILPSENISIYRHTMLANLIQTLTDIYPMIVKLVGCDFFKEAAKEYIQQYPSLSGNLHDYGEYFSDFLAEYAAVKSLPYLAEVATLEWTSHILHFASDANAFDIKSLACFSQDYFQQLQFILHPASRLLQFHYPILRIMDLCNGEIDEEINLLEGGVNLLIIRVDLNIKLVTLTAAQFGFLSALHNGKTIGDALTGILKDYPEFELEQHLPQWIQDKIIVDYVM